MKLQRLPIAPAAELTERCHTHNSMDSPTEADHKMVCVYCAITLHAPWWCILPRIKVKKAAWTLFRASPHQVLRSSGPHYHKRSGERQEQRTKTPYALYIHLITTQLSLTANRHVVNRSTFCPPWINPTTPCRAALRRARDLSSINRMFWSTFSIQNESISGNMQRFADPLAHLSQHF